MCFGDDQDIHVSESWESREQLEAFGQCNRRPNYSPLEAADHEAKDVRRSKAASRACRMGRALRFVVDSR